MMTSTPTPSQPAKPKRCDGLMLQTNLTGTNKAMTAAVQAIVAKRLPGEWQVTMLNRADRLFELIRTNPKYQPTVLQAFDMVRELMKEPEIDLAEIGAIIPGVDPTPGQVLSQAELAMVAKGSKSDDDLPCSADPEWALNAARVSDAWNIPPGAGHKYGKNVVVAHPDTGYTIHPELVAGNRVMAARGYDFESDDPDPVDPLKGKAPSHGTSTGSVIMSRAGKDVPDNSEYVSGVAPQSKLIPIRVSTSVVHLSFRKLTKAIYHAIDTKAHVISMSLGGPFYSQALHMAIAQAIEKGIVVIAAAGNEWPFVIYPAKLKEVIAVAASNCADKPWTGSARGSSVDITAPGESIWRAKTRKTANKPFTVSRSNGTSYATAITAGTCALWIAFHGRKQLITKYGAENLSAAFRLCLSLSARIPSNWKKSKYGSGLVDARALLSLPLPSKSAVATTTIEPKSGGELDQILDYFEGGKRTNARVILARMFNCKPGQLRGAIKEYREELCYHLATNPELRSTLVGLSMAKSASALSAKSMVKKPMFGEPISRGLRHRLGT